MDKIDAESHVRNLYSIQGYSVERNSEAGHPDFIFTDSEGVKLYVEIKTNGDGLKMEQVKWVKEHPEIEVLVYYLNQTNDKKKFKKMKKDKIKEANRLKELREIAGEAANIV